MLRFCLTLSIFLIIVSCKENIPKMYNSTDKLLKYTGRTEQLTDSTTALIGSAASSEFNTKGDSVSLFLQSEVKPRNYVVLTINDEYQKRYQIKGDTINKITLQLPKNEINKIGIHKATEAASGTIIIHKIETEELVPLNENNSISIEFIGDSITCGALADNSDIDCNEGEYLDQHNAYLAYGPRLARTLNAKYVLSSVSGMGMYRNWNDENIQEPIMPQVYNNLYLNTDVSKPYKIIFKPDIVSICLGTNDMSDGDGIKNRLPFNSEKYTSNYIQFVEKVYNRYPNTKVALLNSPMVSKERNDTLVSCLKKVQNHFKDKNIAIFQFDKLFVNGCNYHPSVEDHKVLADQLTPFFKNILSNK
ncbi:GDSL-like Lipase/Acylhydrolase family protein [Flaviramulus basaltis]|uniref:GDSL-like Lipase/Acylhydrolase family protein n=1 Tax=Flaviramulus basaltis TaxID=369401 RepID=A0A1K2IP36_9FLAO|nr:SGNH/GDSL hydrolase family protein [Flaviramulus basaltis]SFZ93459.1 GDSL-like Lipase/Acylhydrolase family protein [Flaviramulus basaltis]